MTLLLELTFFLFFSSTQLVSVISLLSADVPNLDSPANVDAAKQVRGEYARAQTLPPST